MFVYSCYDACQVFRKYSFLKYIKKFDINITVFPDLDSRIEFFTLIIENNDILNNCSFTVDAKKKMIYELDYDITKKRSSNEKNFYEINIKNEVDISVKLKQS